MSTAEIANHIGFEYMPENLACSSRLSASRRRAPILMTDLDVHIQILGLKGPC
jgi:hypothetical protein